MRAMAKKKQSPPSPAAPIASFPPRIPSKKFRWLCYAALFALAAGVRVYSNASHFFARVDPGYRNFEINDSSYQIRRTEITMDHYPHVPFYDTYHYFPDLPAVPWPPGYNLFLATLAKPFDLISSSRLMRESVIGLIPCFMDALTVVLFFFLFSRYVSFSAAFMAAFLLALSTQNVGYSEAGYIDHHYFITFLMALFGLMLYFYHQKPRMGRALLLGSLLGGAVYFNVSAIQYSILALMVVGAHAVVERHNISPFRFPLAVFSAAGFASFLAAFSTPAGRAWKLQYDETSLFQFFLILGAGVCYLLLAIWMKAPRRDGAPPSLLSDFSVDAKKKSMISVGLLFAAGILVAATFKNIYEGAQFLLVGNILNSVQGEEASLGTYYPLWSRVFTWFGLLVPLGLWVLKKKAKEQPFFVALVAIFLAHGILAGSAHFLYIQYLYPWFALVAVLGLFQLMEVLKSWGGLRYGVAAIFLLQATYVGYAETANIDNGEEQAREAIRETITALAWLRDHSPETSYHEAGDGEPEYSVFAHRDYGHQIARISHRPAIVSPFSTTAYVDHMKDYVRATFSREEDDFVRVMERYRSQYLVLDQRDNTMVDFLLGVVKGEPDEQKLREQADSPVFLFRNNLLYFDGELRWKKTPSVRHFRLVYEVPKRVEVPIQSAQGLIRHRFNGLKIFERVSGAKVAGSGFKPGERVIFRLPVQTNTNRKFDYTGFAVADEKGRINVGLAYATVASSMSAVVPMAPLYEVERAAGRKRWLAVSEESVRSGETLTVNAF